MSYSQHLDENGFKIKANKQLTSRFAHWNSLVLLFASFIFQNSIVAANNLGLLVAPPPPYSLIPGPGDIVFTAFQSSFPDGVEWITLRRLDLRNISVTDNGILSNGQLRAGEGTYVFPNIPELADVPAGTIVRLDELSGTNDFDPNDGVIHVFGNGTSVASVPNFNLGTNGDQVIVYSGSSLSPTFIAGITGTSTVANWNSGATGVTNSRAPGTSSDLYFSSNDNAFYNGSVSGNASLIKASALNTSFWNVSASSQVARFDRKNILFDEPIYLNGNLNITNVTSNSIVVDASSIGFLNENPATTRYAMVIHQGSPPSSPADRYTCYPNNLTDFVQDYSTSTNVISSASNICTGIIGNGRLVYLGADKPSNFIINGLSPITNYRISFFALNGNGWSTNFSSSFATISQTTLVSPPTLLNSPLGTITESSVVLQSQVISDGGATVVERGFYWDTYSNPDFPGLGSTWDGTGLGSFSNTVSALEPQTQYWVNAYGVNSTGVGIGVFQSFFTLSNRPITQVSSFVAAGISSSQINLAWEISEFPQLGANVKGYVLIRAENGVAPVFSSQNGQSPSVSVGQIVSSSLQPNQSTFSDPGLSTSTNYTYQIIPFCWDGINPATYNYLSTNAPFASATTLNIGCTKPTVQAQNPILNQVSITSIELNWVNGSGNQSLVVVRENYPVASIPQDGISYSANPILGNGSELLPGEFVAYSGNLNSIVVSNLNPGSTYYFHIYTFNSSNNCYLNNSAAVISGTLTVPNSIIETFEPGIKTTYSPAIVQGNLGPWLFSDALIGNVLGEDQFNDTRSARLINEGFIEMSFSKPEGLSEISIHHSTYGPDQSSQWLVEVSNNNGTSYDAFVSPIFNSTSTGALSEITLPTNILGNIKIRIRKISGNTNRLNIDDISFVGLTATQTIQTLPLINTVCLSNDPILNIPYSIVGSFNSDNKFIAELSDATGNFGNPIVIGQVQNNLSGSITGNIPLEISSGSGYKVRVVSTSPEIIGSETISPLTIFNSVPDASGFYAEVLNSSSVRLNWQSPNACYDEILIVGKSGNPVSVIPSGNGLNYLPNAVFANPSANAGLPSGEFAVYKQSGGATVVVSGLSNLNTYFFKLFIRSGNTWSNGVLISVNPYSPQIGDFQTLSSGNYTNPAIWLTYNGVSWVPANRYPNQFGNYPANVNVKIRTGHVVLLDSNLPSKPIKNLVLESESRLWTNDSTINANRYLSIFGNITCNGNIGNGYNKYDNVSFNVEGSNCTIAGSGNFNCGRIRKNTLANSSTRIIISMPISIKYSAGVGRGCGFYNNANGESEFSLYLNANCNFDLLAPANQMNDLSIDGEDGEAIQQRYGNYTIHGNLNVSGTIYHFTNNLNRPISIDVEANGRLTCSAFCTANAGSSSVSVQMGSNTGGSTLRVKSRGTLEITGGKPENSSIYNLSFCKKLDTGLPGSFSSGIGVQNNVIDLQAGSTVIYSGASGNQKVQDTKIVYANLVFQGNAKKWINDTLRILENIHIKQSCVFDAENNLIYLGGNWNNYDEKGFAEGNSTVILNGSSIQEISNTAGEKFYKLILQNSANTLFDVQIRQQFDMLNGNLNSNGRTVTLGESAVNTGILNYQNGRIIGKMKRWFAPSINSGAASGLFPIGNSQYDQFVTVEFTTPPSLGGSLTAEFVPENMALFGVPANPYTIQSTGSCPEFIASNLSEQGYWKIDDKDGLNGGVYNITFEVEGLTDVIDPCYLTALKRVGNGNWNESGIHLPSAGIAIRPIVKRTQAQGWSNWGLSGGSLNPLPVELIEFTAETKDDHVEIRWTTASELNNAEFIVERSADAVTFETLISVPGAGNSNVTRQYVQLDKLPLPGVSYYRLKQIDFNGEFEYSEIRPVNFLNQEKLRLNYWTVENGQLYLNLNSSEDQIEIVIYDLSGRKVCRSTYLNNSFQYLIDLSQISKGAYLIWITDGKDSITSKIVR